MDYWSRLRCTVPPVDNPAYVPVPASFAGYEGPPQNNTATKMSRIAGITDNLTPHPSGPYAWRGPEWAETREKEHQTTDPLMSIKRLAIPIQSAVCQRKNGRATNDARMR